MRGRRLEADSRFTVHGSWEWAENDTEYRGSFAAVERSMSGRLLRMKRLVFSMPNKNPPGAIRGLFLSSPNFSTMKTDRYKMPHLPIDGLRRM